MSLIISSMAFKDGEYIPTRYTADGRDISPTLAWRRLTPRRLHTLGHFQPAG
jgi:phosphatidylethanolamine-binding protein (PEBP) family uncharacterized protein